MRACWRGSNRRRAGVTQARLRLVPRRPLTLTLSPDGGEGTALREGGVKMIRTAPGFSTRCEFRQLALRQGTKRGIVWTFFLRLRIFCAMKSGEPVSRIHIDPPRQQGRQVRLEGELRTATGVVHRIYFEFTAPDDQPYELRARPFLLALLLPAMNAGAPLEMELPLDDITVSNLMEWQEAMASWHAHALKVVAIRAPRAASPDTARPSAALTAFSGGVDSNFTIWRQTQNVAEPLYRKTSQLKAGLMIHGFDIPLDKPEDFERAWNGSRELLEAAGLTAYRLKTNLRESGRLPGLSWGPVSHGALLAACLACYEPWFNHILIPSTYAYAKMRVPWASNAITDPLYSSATTTYWHDGAGYTKFTKIKAIAANPLVQRHLRVCWLDDPTDRNCGKCFKCVATQVSFQLCGVERPEAFPAPYTPAQLSGMEIATEPNDWLMRTLRCEARRQGRHDMARRLTRALWWWKIRRRFKK